MSPIRRADMTRLSTWVAGLVVSLVLTLGLVRTADASAVNGCPDSGFFTQAKLITDLCWTCIFPIKIFGVPVPATGRSTLNLPSATAAPVCVCPGRTGFISPGITVGFWAPTHVAEMVRGPFCLPTLGLNLGSSMNNGSGMGMTLKLQRGGMGEQSGSSGSGSGDKKVMHNWHWLKFPASALFDMFENSVCSKKNMDMDYLMFTEINPLWHSDVMAMYTHPESKVFAQIYAQAVCAADSVLSSATRPMKQAFWCFGTWGSAYPYTGHQSLQETMEAHLLADARGVAAMHRLGLAKKSYGNGAVCGEQFWFVYDKHQYQYQNFWPLPTRTKAVWTGSSPIRWGGTHRKYPGAEDRVVMNWAYSDCCITLW
jgi:conjugal transfer pilus assembly protein TraU